MRRWSWRIVDLSGRWGMLDVLLVAVVVAWVKLGDLVQIEAGPAALAFTTVVILSLVATALFDPHAMWDDSKEHMTLPVGGGEPAAATGTQSRS